MISEFLVTLLIMMLFIVITTVITMTALDLFDWLKHKVLLVIERKRK